MSAVIKETPHDARAVPPDSLLSALAAKGHSQLSAHAEPARLVYGEVLHGPGAPIEHVYFPADTIVSLLSADEAEAVEVGMVGGEGVVGVSALLGDGRSPHRAVVVRSGQALRVRASVLRREFRRSQDLRERLLPHAQMLLTQNAQSALCHRFHTPRERLCRWLLMVNDRAGSEEFHATQEFISGVLGTRRATVTEVAHDLQEQGLIDYRRGRVHIRDRQRIEQLVCRCYSVIKQGMDSLKAH